mmetsp:Transcript_1355/g.1611  ORF Transcript_1355/g.1611 Transcript_1355/m.1611 type:complete len:121 (+) Transcript_1355:440-802(+)
MYITLDANEDDQSDEDHVLRLMNASKNQALHLNGNKVMFCGLMVKRRNLEIMCAIFSGLWGGSIMLGSSPDDEFIFAAIKRTSDICIYQVETLSHSWSVCHNNFKKNSPKNSDRALISSN